MYEAVVLAGGLGTRLREVIGNYPKPMAEINGKPFLWYLLKLLENSNFGKVVLTVSYKKEVIIDYFKDRFGKIDIVYSIEDEPLGTGGAIKKAMDLVDSNDFFVLNGDTFFNISFDELYNYHKAIKSDITLALKFMEDIHRYGAVNTDETGKVLSFVEKEVFSSGYINAGIYILNRVSMKKIFECIRKPMFSFEVEILPKFLHKINIYGKKFDGWFIDIGVKEDYEIAKKYLNYGIFNRSCYA